MTSIASQFEEALERAGSREDVLSLIGEAAKIEALARDYWTRRNQSQTTLSSGPDGPSLLDSKQTAQRLNLPQTKVEEMLRRGELPAMKLGHYWRVSAEALEGWIHDHLTPGVTAPERE